MLIGGAANLNSVSTADLFAVRATSGGPQAVQDSGVEVASSSPSPSVLAVNQEVSQQTEEPEDKDVYREVRATRIFIDYYHQLGSAKSEAFVDRVEAELSELFDNVDRSLVFLAKYGKLSRGQGEVLEELRNGFQMKAEDFKDQFLNSENSSLENFKKSLKLAFGQFKESLETLGGRADQDGKSTFLVSPGKVSGSTNDQANSRYYLNLVSTVDAYFKSDLDDMLESVGKAQTFYDPSEEKGKIEDYQTLLAYYQRAAKKQSSEASEQLSPDQTLQLIA